MIFLGDLIPRSSLPCQLIPIQIEAGNLKCVFLSFLKSSLDFLTEKY
jgi:hypothetical protein